MLLGYLLYYLIMTLSGFCLDCASLVSSVWHTGRWIQALPSWSASSASSEDPRIPAAAAGQIQIWTDWEMCISITHKINKQLFQWCWVFRGCWSRQRQITQTTTCCWCASSSWGHLQLSIITCSNTTRSCFFTITRRWKGRHWSSQIS